MAAGSRGWSGVTTTRIEAPGNPEQQSHGLGERAVFGETHGENRMRTAILVIALTFAVQCHAASTQTRSAEAGES